MQVIKKKNPVFLYLWLCNNMDFCHLHVTHRKQISFIPLMLTYNYCIDTVTVLLLRQSTKCTLVNSLHAHLLVKEALRWRVIMRSFFRLSKSR